MRCCNFSFPMSITVIESYEELRGPPPTTFILLLLSNSCPCNYNCLIISLLLYTTHQCPINLPLKKKSVSPENIFPLFIKIGPNFPTWDFKALITSMPHTKSSLRWSPIWLLFFSHDNLHGYQETCPFLPVLLFMHWS